MSQRLFNDSAAVRSLSIQMRALLEYIANKLVRSGFLTVDVNASQDPIEGASISEIKTDSPVTSPNLSKDEAKKEKEKAKKEKKERLKAEKEAKKLADKHKKLMKSSGFNPDMSEELTQRSLNQLILQLITLSKCFLDSVLNLMNDVETIKCLHQKPEEQKEKKDIKKMINSFQRMSTKVSKPTGKETSLFNVDKL